MKTIQDVISSEIKGIWGEELSEGEVGIPVIKTNNLRYDGKIDLTNLTLRKLSDKDLASRFLIPGDLLVEKSGGTKTHSVGYVAFFDGIEGKYVANNFIMVLRPNCKLVVAKYLFYQMRYMYETGRFEDCYNKTTGIQNLKAKVYLGKPICLPQTEKQTRIAHLLDIIQNGISLATEQICSLDEQVKSLFNEMFGQPGINEKGYPMVSLGDLAKSINYGTSKPAVKDGKTPYLRMGNMTDDGRIDLSDLKYITLDGNEYEKSVVRDGDFLFNRTNSREHVGRSVAFHEKQEMIIAGYIIRVRLDQTKVETDYLSAFMNSLYMKKNLFNMAKGAVNQANINAKEMAAIKLFLPPLELQAEFVEKKNQIDKLRFI